MIEFYIKTGDTETPFVCTLKDDRTPINLSGSSVQFKMQPTGGGALAVDAPADILDAAAGLVGYFWQTGDTATAGTYRAEWVVTAPDGDQYTVPANGYHIIEIMSRL